MPSLRRRSLALALSFTLTALASSVARADDDDREAGAPSSSSDAPGDGALPRVPAVGMSGGAAPTEPAPPVSETEFLTWRMNGARLDVQLDYFTRLFFDPKAEAFEPPQFNILPMPDLGYNPDEGINTGLVVPMVWNEPGVFPYKYSFGVSLLMSTKLVQNHMFLFDIVDAFDLPLRFTGRTGLYAFNHEPYCGIGNGAACDPLDAERAADRRSLDGPAREDFLTHYDTIRITRPYFAAIARYELFRFLGKWEAFGGIRSEVYVPGFPADPLEREDLVGDPLFDSGPHHGSLYAKDFPDGEPGYVNIPQVGLMLDTRDSEQSPREGYWIEAGVRGAHEWALSSWSFVGTNLTARFYAPLDAKKTITFAQRYAVDSIIGEAPVQELARFGAATDYRGFGGKAVGRGMRQQTRIGDFKVASQHELRWDALQIAIGMFSVGFEFCGFVDAGLVMHKGIDYENIPVIPRRLPLVQVTGGGGMRLVLNRQIIIRFDLGFSPAERYAPLLYVDGGHVF